MFQQLHLPKVAGRLLLHSMPGCDESFVEFLAAAEAEGVETIVSLSPPDEIEAGSPDYARAIEEEDPRLPRMIAVAGRVFPHSEEETGAFYRAALLEGKKRLATGATILVHRGEDLSDAGTFAAALMGKVNLPLDQALELLASSGAAPKTDEQLGFLRSGVDELPEKLAQVDLTGDEGNPRAVVSIAIDLADRLGMDSDAIARELRGAGKAQAHTRFEQHFGEYVQIWVD